MADAGLSVYKPRHSFLKDILKGNKNLRDEVRDQAGTSPMDIEVKRLEVGYLLEKIYANMTELKSQGDKIAAAMKREDESEVKALREQQNALMTSNMMICQLATVNSLVTLIDCVTVAYQAEGDVEGEDGGKKKVTRNIRFGLAELIWDILLGNEEDETRGLLDMMPDKDQVEGMANIMYLSAKGTNKYAFQGEVRDDNGLVIPVPDVIEWKLKHDADKEARRKAQSRDDSRAGVTAEEAERLRRRTMEGLL